MRNSEFIPVVQLPYKVKITYKSFHGNKEITKTALNCLEFKPYSGTVYNDEITLANVPVVISYSNEPMVVSLQLNHLRDNLTFNAGGRLYEVISIDGKDPMAFLNSEVKDLK